MKELRFERYGGGESHVWRRPPPSPRGRPLPTYVTSKADGTQPKREARDISGRKSNGARSSSRVRVKEPLSEVVVATREVVFVVSTPESMILTRRPIHLDPYCALVLYSAN